MFNWEVTFKPDDSIEGKATVKGKATVNDPGALRVVFDPAPGYDISKKPIAGDGIRVKFYGTLRVKSIPGGAGNGSYEIPTIPTKSKS